MAAIHNAGYGFWTEQEDARLRDLVAIGWTFSAIGAEIGRSKGSCIGRAHRLKLEVLPKPPSNSPKALRERAKRAGLIVERAFVPAPIPAAQDNAPQPLFELPEASTTAFGEPRKLMGLRANSCRWPVQGEGADTLFCCAAREGHGPYCREHRLVAWRPTPRQNLAKLAKAYR